MNKNFKPKSQVPGKLVDLDDDLSWSNTKPYKPKHQKPRKEKKIDNKIAFTKENIIKFLKDDTNTINAKFEMVNDVSTLPYFIKGQYGHITGWRKQDMINELEQKMLNYKMKHNTELTPDKIINSVKLNIKKNLTKHERNILNSKLSNIRVESEKKRVEEKYITELYETKLITDEIKKVFNFKGTDNKKCADNIVKFNMPVYGPWIEIITLQSKIGLINHPEGINRYKNYSNKFFNLNNSNLNLSALDKSWNIDFWLSILTSLPSTNNYTIGMLNLLFDLYIELIRSYNNIMRNEERREMNIYKDIVKYESDIYEYLVENGLTEMDYCDYKYWPENVKIAMDAITEGELIFYFGAKDFHKIKIHYQGYNSSEEIIKYIINIIYNANIVNKDYFELENEKCINNKIIKLIYNVLEMPKEVDLKLVSRGIVAGDMYQFYNNKISLLCAIFKYIIGISRQFEHPLQKINKFCMLWNVVKNYENIEFCESFEYKNDIDVNDYNQIFKIVELSQTNIVSLLQVIGYEMFNNLNIPKNENGLNIYLTVEQINIIEDFVNTSLDKIIKIDELYKLKGIYGTWIKYISGKCIDEIPYKFNYTPIKLFRKYNLSFEDLPFALRNNKGFQSIIKELIDMETPSTIGYPL